MQKMAYFYLLKGELLSKYREEYPSWTGAIHDFKTREIANFQNMLERTVGSRISEKWFYTHIKPLENEKLPRIDTLDMLSAFIGYENWEAFVERAYEKRKQTVEQEAIQVLTEKSVKPASKKMFVLVGVIIAMVLLLGFLFLQKTNVYTVCFVDGDVGKAIEGAIEVTVFKEGESPVIRNTDEQGCIHFDESGDMIRFSVIAPYYKRDTIVRSLLHAEKSEVIKLRKDDFALMIHLFSTNNLKDWEKRRKQLDKMISDEAVIFQINEENLGLEMYNKSEFINKLTMPINSLKNIRIVDTKYKRKKIVEMRFVQE